MIQTIVPASDVWTSQFSKNQNDIVIVIILGVNEPLLLYAF